MTCVGYEAKAAHLVVDNHFIDEDSFRNGTCSLRANSGDSMLC